MVRLRHTRERNLLRNLSQIRGIIALIAEEDLQTLTLGSQGHLLIIQIWELMFITEFIVLIWLKIKMR